MAYSIYPMAVADITLQVVRKPVKYLRIKIRPPEGRVQLSVPLEMDDEAVRCAVLSRMDWIRKQRLRFATVPKSKHLEYVSGEKVRFQGREYELNVVEQNGRPCAKLREPGRIDLCVKPGSNPDTRLNVLNDWYRQELKSAIPPLMNKWQRIMGVRLNEWRIKRMKTRWGTCNIRVKRIWINLELVKFPVQFLEFIIVHELTHLLEPSHNARFKTLMDSYLPDWRQRQKELKQSALRAAWVVDG